MRSALLARSDAQRQAFEGAPGAVLEIDPRFGSALQRVTAGIQLIVVTWLHGADQSRSVHLDALDAIDGTPVLDLKVAMSAAPDA